MFLLKNISKSFENKFNTSNSVISILEKVSLSLAHPCSVSILGPSGSGKSTLLSIMAGLDTPTSGEVIIEGKNIFQLSSQERARFRNQTIGYIFQNFELIQDLTILENLLIPHMIHENSEYKDGRLKELLEIVGLSDMENMPVHQLSGGEKQRVGIARAFMMNPKIIFADEPTGNLDHENAEKISDLLFSFSKKEKKYLFLITHNQDIAFRSDYVFEIRDKTLHALQ